MQNMAMETSRKEYVSELITLDTFEIFNERSKSVSRQFLMDPSSDEVSKQETRSFLRERFLRMMAALHGQEANINMYEKTQVQGVIRGMDIDVQTVHVSELMTPIGVLPEAYLRLSDVRKISIPDFRPSSGS